MHNEIPNQLLGGKDRGWRSGKISEAVGNHIGGLTEKESRTVLAGIFQILQTPFTRSGDIDWTSLERQIEYCIAAGVHGLVTPALASEFFTLGDSERKRVVAFTGERIAGRIPFVVSVQGLNLQLALDFAKQACQHEATALMAMPPYLRKAPKPAVQEYYRQLADFDRPLIIQNAPAPIGTPLSPRELAELLAAESNIKYIKEETSPILQHINQILELDAGNCLGVFGGANGIYLIDEMRRGACGNMPAGGMVDVQVKIYNLYVEGNVEEAERIHFRLLPLLNYAMVYGVSLHKFVLWRRGVIDSPHARDPQKISLDKDDIGAIESLWQRIADHTVAEFPFR